MDDSTQHRIELWMPIEESRQEYAVSNFGRIQRLRDTPNRRFRAGEFLKPSPNTDGYLRVNLHVAGCILHRYVHILVASHFLGVQPSPAHEVNHKDGVHTNNVDTNLEWITHIENLKHAREILGHVTYGERNGYAKLTYVDVRRIRLLHGKMPSEQVAASFGVSSSTITGIWRRASWKHVHG